MKNLQFQFSSKLEWLQFQFQFHTKNGTQCPVLEKKVILMPAQFQFWKSDPISGNPVQNLGLTVNF
jgi:hypothetical protein